MTLSWLTATNNHGRFLFSINRNRYSASVLKAPGNQQFVLCVPVKGMEALIRNVGSISGSTVTSKFPQDYSNESIEMETKEKDTNNDPDRELSKELKKSRKRHKSWEKPQFPNGIPGLVRVALGSDDSLPLDSLYNEGFAIQGTVAHLSLIHI